MLNVSNVRPEPDLKCRECGEWIINVRDYASCPALHGKLQPLLNEDEIAYIGLKTLPSAVRHICGRYHLYEINGKRYKLGREIDPLRIAVNQEHGKVVANVAGQVRIMLPLHSKPVHKAAPIQHRDPVLID